MYVFFCLYFVLICTVGVGDVSAASNMVSTLISKGSDIGQKCRWTDMLPLHYASFFDAAPILRVLLKASNAKGTVLTVALSLQILTIFHEGHSQQKIIIKTN